MTEARTAGSIPATGAAPFTIGPRVGIRGKPERGSLIVRDVYRAGDGWRVHAGDEQHGYELHTNAAQLVDWPAGLAEPPEPPFGSLPDGDHPNAWDRKRAADAADPEFAKQFDQWRAAKERWLAAGGTRVIGQWEQPR